MKQALFNELIESMTQAVEHAKNMSKPIEKLEMCPCSTPIPEGAARTDFAWGDPCFRCGGSGYIGSLPAKINEIIDALNELIIERDYRGRVLDALDDKDKKALDWPWKAPDKMTRVSRTVHRENQGDDQG